MYANQATIVGRTSANYGADVNVPISSITGARQSQLLSATESLERQLVELGDAVRFLSDRLEPVMRPELAEKNVPMPPKEVLVPAAATIRDAAERINSLRVRVQSLVERLEV